MRRLRPRVVSRVTLLGLVLWASGPHLTARAQEGTAPARKQKSVYGKLESVDTQLNGLFMRSDQGKRLAWQFPKAVIGELTKFSTGDPMIVIYRQIRSNEKRVTAVAFPGKAEAPMYKNMTGSRVLIRSAAAAADGTCTAMPDPASIHETMVLDGGTNQVDDGCWCCTIPGESCMPGNKTGHGQAILVNCFK